MNWQVIITGSNNDRTESVTSVADLRTLIKELPDGARYKVVVDAAISLRGPSGVTTTKIGSMVGVKTTGKKVVVGSGSGIGAGASTPVVVK